MRRRFSYLFSLQIPLSQTPNFNFNFSRRLRWPSQDRFLVPRSPQPPSRFPLGRFLPGFASSFSDILLIGSFGNNNEYLSSKVSIFGRTVTFRDSLFTFIRRRGLCWMSQPPGHNSSTVDKSVTAFRWDFVVEKTMPTCSSTYFPFSNCWKE